MFAIDIQNDRRVMVEQSGETVLITVFADDTDLHGMSTLIARADWDALVEGVRW